MKKVGIRKQLIAVAMSVATMVYTLVGTGGVAFKVNAEASGYMLQDKSVENLMGDFGVISFDTMNVKTHFHGNFLTKTLEANSNSGLRSNYATYEDFYFEEAKSLNSNISELDEDTLYTSATVRKQNGTETFITLSGGSEQKVDKPKNVKTDSDIAAEGKYTRYADLDDIQSKFIAYNAALAALNETVDGVTSDITKDMNNRSITVEKSGTVVASISYSDLTTNTNAIYYTFPNYKSGDVLVMNIDLSGVSSAVFGEMIIGSKDKNTANSESNFGTDCNRVFFNFYDSSKADGQYDGSITFNGRGFGTIIAPSAEVLLSMNWDGQVVSSTFANGGEFHRVNPASYPVIPTTPTTHTITISKKAITGDDELPGATLSLYEDGKKIAGWVSGTEAKEVTIDSALDKSFQDEDTKEIKLKPGKYTLREKVLQMDMHMRQILSLKWMKTEILRA